jgi:4-amino-4-deoxy-L-arabinose transferase-like glycosyltransferase
MTALGPQPALSGLGPRDSGVPTGRHLVGASWRAGEAAGLAAVMAWVALLLFTRWRPFAATIPDRDSAAYVLAGSLLRDGGVPYVSYWDHKPILIHLVNAAGLALGGGHVVGVWVLSLAALLGAVTLLYVAFRERFGVAAALFGVLFFGASLIGVVEQGNLVELYALPLQAAGVLLLSRWAAAWAAGSRAGFTPGLALGALGALAFLLRQNLVGGAASVALVVAVLLVRARDGRTLLRWLAGGVVAAAAVALSLYVYLRALGAWDAFLDQAFRYNFVYSAVTMRARVWSALAGVEALSPYELSLAVAGWLAALVGLRRRRRDPAVTALLLLAVVWLPIEAVLATTAGREYQHYFMPLVPPLSLGVAIFIAELSALVSGGSVDRERRREARVLLILFAAAFGATAVGPQLVRQAGRGFRPAGGEQQSKVVAVAEYVRGHSPEGSSIFVWGAAPDVYRVAERRPASRFIYVYPLVTPGYTDSAVVERLVDDVERTRPALLIDASSDAPTPPLDSWAPDWRAGPYTVGPELKRWYDLVATDYALADSLRGWKIYRRVERPAAAR